VRRDYGPLRDRRVGGSDRRDRFQSSQGLRLHNSEQFVLEAPVGAGVEKPRYGSVLHDELYAPTDQGSLVQLRREGFHRVNELCPRLFPNACLPSTNTVTYGGIPRDIFAELSC
jgi:phage baseplate assembly protein W